MGSAARKLIQAFEALSEEDRREVQLELIRREIDSPYGEISEDGIVALADEMFVMYDDEEPEYLPHNPIGSASFFL